LIKEGGNEVSVRVERIGDSSIEKNTEKKYEMYEEEKRPIGKQILMS